MLCCRLEKDIMLVIGVVHVSWVSDLDLTDFNAGQWLALGWTAKKSQRRLLVYAPPLSGETSHALRF